MKEQEHYGKQTLHLQLFGYKKIENGVVDGFGKVTDKCVEVLFAKEGESVEVAKKRLSGDKSDNENK